MTYPMAKKQSEICGLVLTDQGVVTTQYGRTHITPDVTKRVSGEVDYLLRHKESLKIKDLAKLNDFIRKSRKEGFNPEEVKEIYKELTAYREQINPFQEINISDSTFRLHNYPTGLKKVVVLPDYSAGQGLGVGTVAVFDRNLHNLDLSYLGPDIGCGMALAKVVNPSDKVTKRILSLQEQMKTQKRNRAIVNIGGGNHFIEPYTADISALDQIGERDLLILIHTGDYAGRTNTQLTGMRRAEYLQEASVKNRQKIIHQLSEAYGSKLEIILDKTHNSVEIKGDKVVYRKGAVKLMSGELTVIPSFSGGEARVVMALDSIGDIENSMCHGTGRKLSRGEYKNLGLKNSEEYRSIPEIFPLVTDYVVSLSKLSSLNRITLEVNKAERQVYAEVQVLSEQQIKEKYERLIKTANAKINMLYGGADRILNYASSPKKLGLVTSFKSALDRVEFFRERIKTNYSQENLQEFEKAIMAKAIIERAIKSKAT